MGSRRHDRFDSPSTDLLPRRRWRADGPSVTDWTRRPSRSIRSTTVASPPSQQGAASAGGRRAARGAAPASRECPPPPSASGQRRRLCGTVTRSTGPQPSPHTRGTHLHYRTVEKNDLLHQGLSLDSSIYRLLFFTLLLFYRISSWNINTNNVKIALSISKIITQSQPILAKPINSITKGKTINRLVMDCLQRRQPQLSVMWVSFSPISSHTPVAGCVVHLGQGAGSGWLDRKLSQQCISSSRRCSMLHISDTLSSSGSRLLCVSPPNCAATRKQLAITDGNNT